MTWIAKALQLADTSRSRRGAELLVVVWPASRVRELVDAWSPCNWQTLEPEVGLDLLLESLFDPDADDEGFEPDRIGADSGDP
jgi:hypothetical protein